MIIGVLPSSPFNGVAAKLIDCSYWKYALRFFSLPLIPEVLSIQIMNQADKLMVTRITGDILGSIRGRNDSLLHYLDSGGFRLECLAAVDA